MKIRFFAELEDFMAFTNYYLKKTPEGRRAMLRSRLLVPFILVMMVLMIWWICGYMLPTFYLLEALIIPAIYSLAWPAINRRKVRRTYIKLADSGDLEIDEETELEFGDEYFSKTLSDAMRRLKYSAVRRVGVEKEHIFITIRGRQTMVVPRRAMPDGGEDLIALLKEKCGADKVA
ncbi:MAG: YcxB family protein [Clostridiales bacterium]|nr:YcxB family protein [Clostridiales bacterium]